MNGKREMSHPSSRRQGGRGFWELRGQYCLMIWMWQRVLSLQVHRWYLVGKNSWYAGQQNCYSKLLWQAGKRSFMKFDNGKYKVLHLGQKKPTQWQRPAQTGQEVALQKITWRSWLAELNTSQQFAARQRTAAYWVAAVRLSSKPYPLSGTPEIASHSFGFPIRKKILT